MTREIGRVMRVGRALYVCIPKSIQEAAGIKRNDRIVMECDGRTILMAKIPMNELISRALLKGRECARTEVE